MRKIDSIIIHCSATQAGMDFSAKDIDRWHRAQGMNEIGYHYVVLAGWKCGTRERDYADGGSLYRME